MSKSTRHPVSQSIRKYFVVSSRFCARALRLFMYEGAVRARASYNSHFVILNNQKQKRVHYYKVQCAVIFEPEIQHNALGVKLEDIENQISLGIVMCIVKRD